MPPFSTARLEMLGNDIYGLLLAAAWLLFGWAAIDYLVEWRSRESRLKMSRDDLRDEFKETEGSPQIRSRIRGLQRQMRRRKVKADVSKAAVVLTNPTHYAVALGFDFVDHGCAQGAGQRAQPAGRRDQSARRAGPGCRSRESAAGALALSLGRSRSVDSRGSLRGRRRHSCLLYRQRVEAEMRERRTREGPVRARTAAARASGQSFRQKEDRR